jgi:hypothetical protein
MISFDNIKNMHDNRKRKVTDFTCRGTCCDKDLFPEDCDCDFDEINPKVTTTNTTKKKNKFIITNEDDERGRSNAAAQENNQGFDNASFSMDYKSLIFPPYKEYTVTKKNDPTMRFWLLQLPPTTDELKHTIVEALQAKKRAVLQEYAEDGNIFYGVDPRLYILDTCLELVYDYNLLGYKKFKKDFDGGLYFNEGALQRSLNVGIDDFVGEVTEFVCPSRELERIIDPFTKAIAIVETWNTENDFVEAWNDFFGGKPDLSNARFVYLGWKFENYLGWDGRFVKGENNVRQEFSQFNNLILRRFWNRARNTVKALLIMDSIEVWAYYRFRSCGLISEPFDFSFD